SVWQFLLPAVAVILVVAVLRVVAFDPVASAMSGRFEGLEANYLGGGRRVTASVKGLGLRPVTADRQAVLHAARLRPDSLALERVMVLDFTLGDRLVERVDADAAYLEEGRWRLANAWITLPNRSGSVFEKTHLRPAN